MGYHHGEYFTGYLPGVSLVMKMLFQFQAFWVAYATEYHLNNLAFKSKTEHDEEMEELSRRNFWWFMARYEVVRAVKEKLGFASPKVVEEGTDEDEDEDEDKEESTEEDSAEEEEKEDDDVVDTAQVINVKRRSTVIQIQKDILMDKEAGNVEDEEDTAEHEEEPEKAMNVYRRATLAALKKHKTLRIMKRKTTKISLEPETAQA